VAQRFNRKKGLTQETYPAEELSEKFNFLKGGVVALKKGGADTICAEREIWEAFLKERTSILSHRNIRVGTSSMRKREGSGGAGEKRLCRQSASTGPCPRGKTSALFRQRALPLERQPATDLQVHSIGGGYDYFGIGKRGRVASSEEQQTPVAPSEKRLEGPAEKEEEGKLRRILKTG